MGSLLNQVGALVTKDIEKAVTECFLCSVFIAKARLWESLSMEARAKFRGKEDLPLVKEDQISYPLVKLDIQKSIGRNEMHS